VRKCPRYHVRISQDLYDEFTDMVNRFMLKKGEAVERIMRRHNRIGTVVPSGFQDLTTKGGSTVLQVNTHQEFPGPRVMRYLISKAVEENRNEKGIEPFVVPPGSEYVISKPE